MENPHESVLLREAIDALALSVGDRAIDCTVGAGGHTEAMLEKVGENGLVIGIDRDQSALDLAGQRLSKAKHDGRVQFVHSRFSGVGKVAKDAQIAGKIQGILADIGVSSMHLDQDDRGFSLKNDGPLDMRMNTSDGQTAADLVNKLTESELTRIFRDCGEEPQARGIAKAIVRSRTQQPFTTTQQLANLVKDATHYKSHSRRHPATRVFQALRITVNQELDELHTLLDTALDLLQPGGRLAVICFHSLEDRMVKRKFLDLTASRRDRLPRGLPVTEAERRQREEGPASIVKPFPRMPSDEEIQNNPRARSARLRVLQRRL